MWTSLYSFVVVIAVLQLAPGIKASSCSSSRSIARCPPAHWNSHRASFVSTPFLPRAAGRGQTMLRSDRRVTPPLPRGNARDRRETGSPLMSVTDAHQSDVSQLLNPHNVSTVAMESGLDLYRKLMACEDPTLKEAVQSAMQVLRDSLRLYGPERLIGSYNGGKDAVVIMHLHRAAMAQYSVQQGQAFRTKLIYFENDREFPEVEKLVLDSTKKYDLDLSSYKTGFVDGLKQRMEEGGNDKSYAFVLGTRKGDPNCGVQTSFTPSSDWMPPFMRVNPILDWNYGQVWSFLRSFNLPYCVLYDKGYTSLGNLDNSFPNPALKKPDSLLKGNIARKDTESQSNMEGVNGQGSSEYLPAYMLSNWSLERAGRGKRTMDSLACELRGLESKRRKVRDARSAGLVVIGDEILKGKCDDSNTAFATKNLWKKGIPVKRVAVVADDEAAITEEVRRQVQEFDVVITSGGVGPTHDDITINSVARALNQSIQENEDMLERLAHNFGVDTPDQLTEAQKKMAMLPEMSKLRVAPLDGQKSWPILQTENVFILPGVPKFFQSKMQVIVDHFLDSRPMHLKKIVLSADELLIVNELNDAVARHPKVTFGSYPYHSNPAFKTVVTLEGEIEADVTAAAQALEQTLPEEYVVKVVADDNLKDV